MLLSGYATLTRPTRLHGYYASHDKPYPVKVAYLQKLSGSQTKDLKKYRQNLKKAHDDLVKVGLIRNNWHIDDNDLVHVEKVSRLPKNETAPPLPTPTHARFLEPDTIEKFSHLYPRLNAYDCKTSFDEWLKGKKNPQNYDAAFLGFAKKWVAGKH